MVKTATDAASEAARGAVDLCLSGGAFGGFSFSLKIDNPWLAAGIAIGAFYIANKALTERAIRNALQQQTSSTANADPEVIDISTGFILVQLRCYKEESFLRFTDDIDSKKAKYRLEEELATMGFREEIRLTVENKEELEILRCVAAICFVTMLVSTENATRLKMFYGQWYKLCIIQALLHMAVVMKVSISLDWAEGGGGGGW